MKRKYFSLVELLLVVTILSILSLAVVKYYGVGNVIGNRMAIRDINNLEAIIRQYRNINKLYPSDFDSLLSASFQTNIENTRTNNGFDRSSLFSEPNSIVLFNTLELSVLSNLADINFISNLSPLLVERLQRIVVSQKVLNTLAYSGIRSLRYVDSRADHNIGAGQNITIGSVHYNGINQRIGRLKDSLDPGGIFNRPTGGGGGGDLDNLGRGASFPIAKDNLQLDDGIDLGLVLAIWKPGQGGINNLVVGANENDYLLALGIGDYNFLFNPHNNKLFKPIEKLNFLDTTLITAPRFKTGSNLQNVYNAYIALFKVGEILSANGDKDISQYMNSSTGNNDAHRDSYDDYELGTAGLRILREVEFITIVDCFGNIKANSF